MHFNQSELQQLTPEYIKGLPSDRRDEIIESLRKDLIEAHDRLNQNSSNSSRPPSSCPPWERPGANSSNSAKKEDGSKDSTKEDPTDSSGADNPVGEATSSACNTQRKRKPGKQPGSKGFGRTQKLPISRTVIHKAEYCKGCGIGLKEDLPFSANGGHYTIDLLLPAPGEIGLRGECIKHIYGSVCCDCGFQTTTLPHREPGDSEWIVEIGEWRLIGPCLLAFLIFLKVRMHMTVGKSRELLAVWLGIQLSDGCMNTALREAGRAAFSLEPMLLDALIKSGILHVDETGWKEHKITRWFWAAIGENTAYYTVGPRSSETAVRILQGFQGWLMTDGYGAYRQFEKRLRCWSHLERKAKALAESWDKDAATFGAYALRTMEFLRDGVYRMRGSQSDLEISNHSARCDDVRISFLLECLRRNDAEHKATRAFAVEILNDHEAIFCVLKHPELPLTNNRVELFIRNWVILRKMSHGSKTKEGSRTVAILASVVDTLRLRKAQIWDYITELIRLRRSGHSPPCFPQPI